MAMQLIHIRSELALLHLVKVVHSTKAREPVDGNRVVRLESTYHNEFAISI